MPVGSVLGPFLDIPDKPEIFVVGDAAAATQGGRPLPGVAQVAVQQGRYVGHFISAMLDGRPKSRSFRYFDKGNMAVIGRGFAVLDSRFAKMSGLPAWLAWAFIHILFLPAFGNRLRVWTQAMWSYFSRQRSSQLIVEARSNVEPALTKAQFSAELRKVV